MMGTVGFGIARNPSNTSRPIWVLMSGYLYPTKQSFPIPNNRHSVGRRLNGFLGLSLNDRTIVFLVILLDKTVSVGYNSL